MTMSQKYYAVVLLKAKKGSSVTSRDFFWRGLTWREASSSGLEKLKKGTWAHWRAKVLYHQAVKD